MKKRREKLELLMLVLKSLMFILSLVLQCKTKSNQPSTTADSESKSISQFTNHNYFVSFSGTVIIWLQKGSIPPWKVYLVI